jgi:hypothetical protein
MFKKKMKLVTFVVLLTFALNVVLPFTPKISEAEAASAGTYLTQKWVASGVPQPWEGGTIVGEVVPSNSGLEVIVAGGGTQMVTCLSGMTGAVLWSYHDTALQGYSQPILYDLNGDGKLEVIVPLTYPAGLLVLNGDGTLFWRKMLDYDGQGAATIFSKPVIGDVNGDGKPEIFVGEQDVEPPTMTGKIFELSNTGTILATSFAWRTCSGGLSLGDVNNDGQYELFAGDRNAGYHDGGYGKGVRAWRASDLSVLWDRPDIMSSSQAPDLIDVNGDGKLEVVVNDMSGGVIILNGMTGATIKQALANDIINGIPNYLPGHYQTTVYDIDLDGHIEHLFQDGDHGHSNAYVFDLATWKIDAVLDTGLGKFAPGVGDVTGDGVGDMVVANNTNLMVFDNKLSSWMLPLQTVKLRSQLNNPIIADIDDDGLNEVIISCSTGTGPSGTGTVYCFDTLGIAAVPVARSNIQYYSERRDGASVYVPPIGSETIPDIISTTPANNAVNVPISTSQLTFQILDKQSFTMSYTLSTSPNISGGTVRGSNLGNGVQTVSIGGLAYSTQYTWTIQLSTGVNTETSVFTFFTAAQPQANSPPTENNPAISYLSGDGSVHTGFLAQTSGVSDPQGDLVTNIFSWLEGGKPIANLLLPFDINDPSTAKDYSGYSNNGIVHGATWVSTGKIGGAYKFDGVDDYISVPDGGNGNWDGSIHPSTLSGDGTWTGITIEQWIYLSANQRGTRTIAKWPAFEIGIGAALPGNSTVANNVLYGGVFTWNPNAQYPLFTSQEKKVTDPTPLALNTWYHVALTYTNGAMILYVNGVAVASTASQIGPVKPSSGQDILIGGRDYFNGMIDDTRIYSRNLPASQILQDYLDTENGLSGSATLNTGTTRGGWSYIVQVTPNDGVANGLTTTSNALSLPNTVPVASNLYIKPRQQLGALDNEALTANYTYTDADGQLESGSQISWYRNGVLQSALNNQKVVAASLTTVGDQWYFTVTPSDGITPGATQTSSPIIIRNNVLPTTGTPQLTTSGGPNTSSTLTTTATTSDSDGDPTTNIYNWVVNGASMCKLNLPFDTYSNTTTHDYSGTVTDLNIILKGAKWSTGGISSGYLNFDGSHYAMVNDVTPLNPSTWTTLSVDFWVKPSLDQTSARIIGKKYGPDSVGSYLIGMQSSAPANTVFFDLEIKNTTDPNGYTDYETSSNPGTIVPTGCWSHVVATYQSGVGISLYINGTLRSILGGVTGTIFDWGTQYVQPLWIGYDGGGPQNRFFQGGVDEVKIYNRTLTPSQIQEQFLEGKNGVETTSKIMPSELKAGDAWSCKVTPNDGFGDGVTATSSPLTLAQGATGYLRVTTSPPTSSTILVNGQRCNDWGLDWVKMLPGTYTISFTGVLGYITPLPQTVTVTAGQTTTVTGVYTQAGYLRIMVDPALDATIYLDGHPMNDWGAWLTIAPGQYTVSFGSVNGYATPASQIVTVNAGGNTVVTGHYISGQSTLPTGYGYLRVVTNPALPGTIYVDGLPRNDWGLDWAKFPPGQYVISFGDVPGYQTPAPQTVTVSQGQTTVVTGAYVALGYLHVTTSPPKQSTIYANGVTMNDWGCWVSILPGSYQVSWGQALGGTGTIPIPKLVTVSAGSTTIVTGVFP